MQWHGGWYTLGIVSCAAVLIIAVAVSGADLAVALLAAIAIATIWRHRDKD